MKTFKSRNRIFPTTDLSGKSNKLKTMLTAIEHYDKQLDQAINNYLYDDQQSGLLIKALKRENEELCLKNKKNIRELDSDIDNLIDALQVQLDIIHKPLFELTYEWVNPLEKITKGSG